MSADETLVEAFRHALSFTHGEEVQVNSARYHGPGTITRKTHWESHIIVLHHETEVHVAVLLENGNIWFYPALDVWHTPETVEPEALGIAPHTGAWSAHITRGNV